MVTREKFTAPAKTLGWTSLAVYGADSSAQGRGYDQM